MLEDCLLPSAAELEAIARETHLIQRASHKFNASGFLLAMLQSVTKGDTSLNQLAMHLAAFVKRPMTRQAMWQRFGRASSAFLLKVIHQVIERRHPEAAEALRSCPFSRVIVEDSTVISMAKSNASNFPNNGNGRHETAGCKCLLSLDLLRGKPVDFQLHAAREADQSLAYGSVDLCRGNDLIIRDMGFFHIAALREIGDRKAFWISRLPASASLRDAGGEPVSRLLEKASGDHIDIVAVLGREGLPCRLLASRLDPQRAAANRRRIRAEAKRRGITPGRESLHRAGWRILVTNIPATMLPAPKIHALYALRWSIEIDFRAFKQSCQISRGLKHRSGFHHIETMVLAAMLFQLLAIKLHATLSRKPAFQGGLSIEKVSDLLSLHLMRITCSIESWRIDPDPRHLRYEIRKRVNHWQRITQSLA
jgi:hypothetical protein